MLSARVAVVVGAVACAATLGGATSCARRARMCAAPGECGAHAACVAGRCQPDRGIPAIQATRRVVLEPSALAFVQRGSAGGGEGAIPATITLGRDGDGDARLFLRFAAPIPEDASIVEAYLLLERADAPAPDPGVVTLHAARVVEPWDPRSISWGVQPRLEEVGAAATRVGGGGRRMVRVDVRALVERWRSRDRADHGIALLADTTTRTGMAFAAAPAGPAEAAPASFPGVEGPADRLGGAPPRLELYLR